MEITKAGQEYARAMEAHGYGKRPVQQAADVTAQGGVDAIRLQARLDQGRAPLAAGGGGGGGGQSGAAAEDGVVEVFQQGGVDRDGAELLASQGGTLYPAKEWD